MNTVDWEKRHIQFDAALDADQAERIAVIEGSASVEAGLEDERMAGVVDDGLIAVGNAWAERQEILEAFSGGVTEEVQRRSSLMGSCYPFAIDGGSLKYQRSVTGAYEFCLAAALNPVGAKEGYYRVSAIFEYLSRDVLRAFFGHDSLGFRTGWPPYDSEGRGKSATETFRALHEKTGEFRWSPRPDLPPNPVPKHLKDAGLDIVVWKPWREPQELRRFGQFFALGQCACGKSDLEFKAGEAARGELENWLRPVTDSPPVSCFFAAHHLPNDTHLRATLCKAGLVFDRARIVSLAESEPDFIKRFAPVDYHEAAQGYGLAF